MENMGKKMFQTTNQITSQPFKHMIAHESHRSQALDYLRKMTDPSNLVVRLGLHFPQDSYKINKMVRFRHPAANKYNYFTYCCLSVLAQIDSCSNGLGKSPFLMGKSPFLMGKSLYNPTVPYHVVAGWRSSMTSSSSSSSTNDVVMRQTPKKQKQTIVVDDEPYETVPRNWIETGWRMLKGCFAKVISCCIIYIVIW